jgi:hypothetical protein
MSNFVAGKANTAKGLVTSSQWFNQFGVSIANA